MTHALHRLGSLYFNGSDIKGCEPVVVTTGSHEVRDRIKSRFCVGPIVRREFWDKERCNMHQHQGPCKCPKGHRTVAGGLQSV